MTEIYVISVYVNNVMFVILRGQCHVGYTNGKRYADDTMCYVDDTIYRKRYTEYYWTMLC